MSNEIEIVVKSKDASAGGIDAMKARIADLKERVRDLSRQKIQIDADVDQARQKLAKLRAELKSDSDRPKTVIEADVAGAEAKLEELQRKSRALAREKATLQIDTGQAQAELQAVQASLKEVNGETAHANVDVDVAGALAKIGMVTAALAAASVGAAGLGAAAGLGTVAAAGIGVVVAGLSGVGDAVKALGEENKGAAAAASRSASQHLAMAGAIDRVRSARAALANTTANAASAEHRATERVTEAQEDLSRAREVAAQRVKDLVRQQADLARQQEDMARRQEDMARQQEDLALAQEGALLDVRQAQEELDKVRSDPRATELQREQAEHAYKEALQHNKDLTTQAKNLAAEKTRLAADDRRLAAEAKDLAAQRTAAEKKGVEGSAEVVAAHKRVADAVSAAADVQRQNAYQVAQAQQAVIDAQRGVQQASVAAGAAGAASADKMREAMAGLTPEGQSFARFLRGFVDGPIKDLRAAGQAGLLPGLQKGLASLGPMIEKNLPAFKSFSAAVGDALGGAITVAGKLAPTFLKMATVGLNALSPLEGVFTTFADAFAKMVDQVTKDGSLQAAMGGVVQMMAALLTVLPQIIPPLIQLAVVVLPLLAKVIAFLAPLVADLAGWLADHIPGAVRLATRAVRDLLAPLLALGRWLVDNQEWLLPLAAGILAVAAAIKVWTLATKAQQLATEAYIVVQALLNTVMSANPIGIIIVALVGLAAAIVVAWKRSETFRKIVTGAFGAVRDAAIKVWHWIKDNWPYLLGALTGPFGLAAVWIYKHWDQVVDWVKKIPGRLADAGRGMWDWVSGGLKGAANAVLGGFEWLLNRVIDGINTAINIADIVAGPWINFPEVPHVTLPRLMASGGIGSGLAVVGERGRELVKLPSGSTVIPNNTAENMLGQASGPARVVLELRSGGSRLDDLLVEIIRKSVSDRGGNVQVVLGRG